MRSEIESRKGEERALLIGFGNPTRQDDAVGYVMVNRVNERLGLSTLDAADAILEPRAVGRVATLWLQQLTADLAETIYVYNLVLLVDAHTGAYPEPIRVEQIEPAYHASLVTHHMKPQTLLAFCRDMYEVVPRTYLVSIRGHDFDFGTRLSDQTAVLVDSAFDTVWAALNPHEASGK